jgi:hypothetical protein
MLLVTLRAQNLAVLSFLVEEFHLLEGVTLFACNYKEKRLYEEIMGQPSLQPLVEYLFFKGFLPLVWAIDWANSTLCMSFLRKIDNLDWDHVTHQACGVIGRDNVIGNRLAFLQCLLVRCQHPEIQWVRPLIDSGNLGFVDCFLERFSFEEVFFETCRWWRCSAEGALVIIKYTWSKRPHTTVTDSIRVLKVGEYVVSKKSAFVHAIICKYEDCDTQSIILDWVRQELDRLLKIDKNKMTVEQD